jgi:nicotinamide-nucleotide amidase
MKSERVVGKLLTEKKLTLATAESCTGGLIAHRITNVPGSSNYFERGFVTYSNRSKTEMLGVEARLLSRFGAVSRQVARAMAVGVKRVSGASVGLAVTGIAGPVTDQSKKPVGLVYVAVCGRNGSVKVRQHNFAGTRLQIKKQSAESALALLMETVEAE